MLHINSIGTYVIDCQDHYVINSGAIGLPTMPTNNTSGIASQATSITILHHLCGEEINIDFYNTSINYWVWLKFKTNNTTTALY
jgi:hypothetical protein